MEWWKQNSFDIPTDQWMKLVKYSSQGAADLIFKELNEKNRPPNRFEKILSELKLCDWGRYGYTKKEAILNDSQRDHDTP